VASADLAHLSRHLFGLRTVIVNHSGRRVPYYFLDADRIGTVGLTLNACLLAAMFLGVSYGVVLLNRVRTQASTETTVVANG
jgi:hypothetical protein